MHPPKAIIWIALVVLIAQTTGCQTFQPLDRPLPTTWREGMPDRRIRLFTTDGQTYDLWRASMDPDSVKGFTYGVFDWVSIPSGQVAGIQESRVSVGRSVLLVVAIGALIGGLAAPDPRMDLSGWDWSGH